MRARDFSFDGHRFAVAKGVFDPVRHLSGLAFAEQLDDVVVEHAPTARTALDLGTGSGLLAATLARRGMRVVAADIDKGAVVCAAQNCQGLDVEVRHGDMFAPVEGDTFDLVVVNPPYERNRPSWRRSQAFTSPDFLEKLGERVHDFAPVVVVGFPVDEASTLQVSGLNLSRWRTVETPGRALGLFVSVDRRQPVPSTGIAG